MTPKLGPFHEQLTDLIDLYLNTFPDEVLDEIIAGLEEKLAAMQEAKRERAAP